MIIIIMLGTALILRMIILKRVKFIVEHHMYHK